MLARKIHATVHEANALVENILPARYSYQAISGELYCLSLSGGVQRETYSLN
jgi:hypothetical protein